MSLTDVTVSTALVSVWHRVDRQIFFEWDSSDSPSIEQAYSYRIPMDELLEEAPHTQCFRINNRVDGLDWEQPVIHETRSLSVGDVVRVELPEVTVINWTVQMSGLATISEKDFIEGTAGENWVQTQ